MENMGKGQFKPIYGIETEFASTTQHCYEDAGRQTDATLISWMYKNLLADGLRNSGATNHFLENGQRWYIDMGNLMEGCTAETRSIEEAVAADYGVEQKAEAMFRGAQNAGMLERFVLRNRALHILRDENGVFLDITSTGRHQNIGFRTKRVEITNAGLANFGLIAATRSFLIGAGAILLDDAAVAVGAGDGTDAVFTLSQKVPVIYDSYRNDTTNSRGVVNLRNTPYAQPGNIRVHDSSSEHTPSPWGKRMGLGMAAIGLALTHYGIEVDAGVDNHDLHGLARRVSFDMSNPRNFTYGDGIKEAIEIHRKIIAAASFLSTRVDLDRELHDTLGMWSQALVDFEDDPTNLIDRSDAVAKRVVLQQYVAKTGAKWNSLAVEGRDKHWDIADAKGFARRIQRGRWARWMPSQAAIDRTKRQPPASSRAQARGRLVTYYRAQGTFEYASWDRVISDGHHTLKLEDPRQTHAGRMERTLIAFARDQRLEASDGEYQRQQEKAARRRTKNEARSRSRPHRG